MKQMKFFLVALMAVMSVTFTSCLNGESNPIVQVGEIVRANYMGNFTNQFNMKLVPTNSTDIYTGNMYYIVYEYDSSTITSNTTSVDITLFAATCVDGPSVHSTSVTANAPIYGFNTQGYEIPRFFDENTLVIPFFYWFKEETDETKHKAEMDKHSFILYYDHDAIKETDTELNFYLVHQINETEPTERLKYTGDFKTYNLSGAIADFKGVTGKVPSKIIVNAKTNNISNTLDNANNGKITLEYKSKSE